MKIRGNLLGEGDDKALGERMAADGQDGGCLSFGCRRIVQRWIDQAAVARRATLGGKGGPHFAGILAENSPQVDSLCTPLPLDQGNPWIPFS